MARHTAFLFDEMTLWHSASQYALTLPVGGWVQPLAGGGHAESPETKRRLKNLMDVSGLSGHLKIMTASPADESDLLRVHPAHYLDRFKSLSDAGGGELDHRAPIGPGSYEIAKLSAGLAIAAVETVLQGEATNAYSLSRPPGHHCLPDKAMGFCFLANIPVAIESAKARFGLGKVAVIDWDVHHGNGTQTIYYNRPDVLTISIHQDRCFPPGYSGTDDQGEGSAAGTNLNIPLLAGSGHKSYLEAMESVVIPALQRFEPELIIVACGYDANAVDPLARMLAHSETFRCMTRLVREAAERLCQGQLVFVHEGGYSEAYVPFCGLAVMEELSGHRTKVNDPLLDTISKQQPGEEQRALQSGLIKEMAKHFNLSR
ncbi:class II histone deacetylase [Pseudomonas rustica]